MCAQVIVARMNGLGNRIIVADIRGQHDRITQGVVCRLAQTDETAFDQIMAIYDSQCRDTDYSIEIWNRDGSRAQACGNGMRCVVEYLYRQNRRKSYIFDTIAGPVCAQRLQNGQVSVDMGKPHHTSWRDIPLAEAVQDTSHVALSCGPFSDASVVSMGNPHAVFFVENDVAGYALDVYGPLLERDPLFPERANISIARMTSLSSLDLRTWERGAGLTRACGTAACASVVAAHRRGLAGRKATVTLPGGDLTVSWEENDHIMMTGPTEYEFSGRFDLATGQYTRGTI